VTLRELNRTLLLRQMLLERRRVPLTRAVAKLVALQAQYAPSPYVALWARIEGFRKEQLTRALVDGTVVKAASFRTTLHVMSAAEYPSLASSYIETQRGRSVPAWRKEPWVRTAPVEPWPHTKPSPAVLWPEPLPDALESSIRVVRRYLAAYGPATRDDVVQFTGFRLRQVDPALDGLRTFEDEAGRTLHDVPRAPLAPGDSDAPVRFLPAFDSIILAHRDRSRILPPEYREAVIDQRNATTKNTFTVDGFVAGAWRVVKKRIVVEPFAPLPARWRREVDAEGERLLAWYLA
jgi:hypothetical protein